MAVDLAARTTAVETSAFADRRYDAFLSHRRSVDGELAESIQRVLARIARPLLKRVALRVFRDVTDLAATESLPADIKYALRESRALVVLCHPEASARDWIQKEIEFWLSLRRVEGAAERPIYLVLTAGSLVWGEEDFDGDASPSLPRSLLGAFDEEPAWVDLTDVRDPPLDLRGGAFYERCAAIAAPLHGPNVTVAGLVGVENRQYRRRLQLMVGALALLLVSTALAVTQWVRADAQTRVAEQERDRAEDQTRLANAARGRAEEQTRLAEARLRRAESHRLITLSDARRSTAPDAALSYALSAWEQDNENPLALRAVLRSYYEPDGFPIHVLDKRTAGRGGTSNSYFARAFDADSEGVWVLDREDSMGLHHVTWNGARSRLALPRRVYDFALDSGGDGFITVNAAGAALWNRAGTLLREYPLEGASFVTLSPDGARVLVSGVGDGSAIMFNRDGRKVVRLCCHDNTVDHASVAPNGRIVTAGGHETRLWAASGRLLATIPHNDYVTSATFSPDGEVFATTTWDSEVRVWWGHDGKHLKSLPGHHARAFSAVFSPDGQKIATASWDGTLRVWDARSLSTKSLLSLPNPANHDEVAWSPNGRWLVSSGGLVVTLWDVSTKRHLPLDFASSSRIRTDVSPSGPFRLKRGYRGVQVLRGSLPFFDFPIPFRDQRWHGRFSVDRKFVDTNARRRFPFSPEAIRTMVFDKHRFGPLARVPLE